MNTLHRSALQVTFCALLLTACAADRHGSDSTPSRNSTPTTETITSSYSCEYIPRSLIQEVTGTHLTSEFRDVWTTDHGSCLVYDLEKTAPVATSWAAANGPSFVMQQAHGAVGRLTWLSQRLGHGFTSYEAGLVSDRPYYGIVSFACGGARPWLRISLRDVRAGRDYVRDLEELLRIAEGRFGELRGCRPGPV